MSTRVTLPSVAPSINSVHLCILHQVPFIHFFHSFSKYLLSPYYMVNSVLRAGDITKQSLCPLGAYIPLG